MPAGYGFIPGAQIMYISKIHTQKRTIKRKITQKKLRKGKTPTPLFYQTLPLHATNLIPLFGPIRKN